jgi:hypothetical protein
MCILQHQAGQIAVLKGNIFCFIDEERAGVVGVSIITRVQAGQLMNLGLIFHRERIFFLCTVQTT